MTQRFSKSVFVAGAFAAIVAAAFAQQKQAPFDPSSSTTEQIHARMLDIADQIGTLRANFGRQAYIDRLTREYEALSQMLGGDDPASWGVASGAQGWQPVAQGPQQIVNPTCSGSASTTNISGTTGVISAGQVPTTYTCAVSGVGTYLWDINLNTTITHTACGDIDMTLTSPGGTTIVISTDNGGTLDNVFNGTVWDDNINDTAADRTYTNLVTATPLNPEGRFAAFRGEDPNGTWTLTIVDDTTANLGSVNAWSLDVTTATAPTETTNTYSDSPAIAISTGAPASYPDTQIVSGAGNILTGLKLYLEVPHTFVADLDITLQPPTGPAVKVVTDVGVGEDNVFNGTTFDPDSTLAPNDFTYVNNVVIPTIAPEGAFDNWLGIDPNGTWTCTVADDANADGGTFQRWDLIVTTTTSPLALSGPSNFAGTTGAITDAGTGGPTGPLSFTAVASGLGTYLWDVDLSTTINHTAGADIDMTLTSPAGTVVTITTDNGLSQAFNGTLWDDNATTPVTDNVFVAGSAATTVAPEGRLAAFRGEDPNGVWTLKISDDASGNGGSLNAWSLGLSTIAAPTTNTTTLSSTPGIVIPATAPPLIFTDNIIASGLGTSMTGLKVTVEIPHTFPGDLIVKLQSPGGTTAFLTTRNGGTNDNAFGNGSGSGTTFDPDSLDTPTDHVYTVGTTVAVLSPEGAFDIFNGQDPNGTWTMTVSDEANIDGGTWVRWSMDITTCASSVVINNCQILPTVTNGCDSVASATGTPSATSASPFTVSFASLNGQVNGVVFYGINGPNNAPWSAQSNLCVKTPTQRLNGIPGASGNTGGTLGACDGAYSFDFNPIIQGAFPGLLGTPMAAGQAVDVQGWQRDAASAKTTNLTDSMSFVVAP